MTRAAIRESVTVAGRSDCLLEPALIVRAKIDAVQGRGFVGTRERAAPVRGGEGDSDGEPAAVCAARAGGV